MCIEVALIVRVLNSEGSFPPEILVSGKNLIVFFVLFLLDVSLVPPFFCSLLYEGSPAQSLAESLKLKNKEKREEKEYLEDPENSKNYVG